MSDYERIETAMAFMVAHAARQPALEEVAAQVHLSPYHFQRLFCRWAGTTPKRFLQALTLERGKYLLREPQSLLDVSHELGLSSSSRLYDHFVQLDAVTPGEYRDKGRGLTIDYGVHSTPFGEVFIAMTPRGICRLGFTDHTGADELIGVLAEDWPLGALRENPGATRQMLDRVFGREPTDRGVPLSLHVTGTNFQVAVWRALLQIPFGALASYGRIAEALAVPGAARAVGSAIGANPVGFVIPCHRVIRQSGALGGYRWGVARKQMIQAWESALMEPLSG